jgi:hypothetical protein
MSTELSDADAGRPDFPHPEGAVLVRLLNVDYLHLKTADGGDLYLTRHGMRHLERLRPENWYEKAWFEQRRQKLEGTSAVYKVPTKPVDGRSLDLVVKWCRVGETVPVDTFTLTKFTEAEFNSPYEEFSLVMEMREQSLPLAIRTHRPLAIFVPAKRLQLWQTGRSTSKIEQKKAKFRDVELDICRQYILVYEWVKGVSAVEAYSRIIPDREQRASALEKIAYKAASELARRGYRVLDMKPEHVIVRELPDGSLLRNRGGEVRYALVDFELLERTPEYDIEVKASRRADYLRKQRDRFHEAKEEPFPEHLHAQRIFGVDYVYGRTESTQGALWVVGRDPGLFDFFQPERWRRTPRRRLSQTNQVYYTKTKDNINLVWKVSRVGETPDVDTSTERGRRIAEYGFNSPFEEFARALELARRGVPGVYPRAIYMTGQESQVSDVMADGRRYQTHGELLAPEGTPLLRPDHIYIAVWGFWNGLDEMLASRDGEYCKGVNVLEASAQGSVTDTDAAALLERQQAALAEAGFEDLNLKPDHILLSLAPQGAFLKDHAGRLELRHCNFELMRCR